MDNGQENSLRPVFDKLNSQDNFARLLGVKLTELQPGFARTTIRIGEDTIDNNGTARLGVIYSLADMGCEAVGNSFGEQGVAVQNNIYFCASGKLGDILEATAKVVKRIDEIKVIEFEVRNQEGLLLAKGTQHLILKEWPVIPVDFSKD